MEVRSTEKVDLDAEKEVLRRIHKEMLVTHKSDVDKVMKYMAKDAILIPPKGRPIEGAETIREAAKEMVKTTVLSMSGGVTRLEVAESGDLAYDIGNFKIVNQKPEGPSEEEGYFVTLYKKIGGEWKFMGQIWNNIA